MIKFRANGEWGCRSSKNFNRTRYFNIIFGAENNNKKSIS